MFWRQNCIPFIIRTTFSTVPYANLLLRFAAFLIVCQQYNYTIIPCVTQSTHTKALCSLLSLSSVFSFSMDTLDFVCEM